MINELHGRFEYHAPSDERKKDHEGVRNQCWDLAAYLMAVVPPGRELSVAVTKVEEAMFWANAGVARQ